jgi:hypothetical protein
MGAPGSADLFHQTLSKMQPAPIALTNDDVVRLVKAGRPADYITASIRHAPQTKFDLSAGEVLKMQREGVSKDVLKAMTFAQLGPRHGPNRWMYAVVLVVGGMALLMVPVVLAHSHQ